MTVGQDPQRSQDRGSALRHFRRRVRGGALPLACSLLAACSLLGDDKGPSVGPGLEPPVIDPGPSASGQRPEAPTSMRDEGEQPMTQTPPAETAGMSAGMAAGTGGDSLSTGGSDAPAAGTGGAASEPTPSTMQPGSTAGDTAPPPSTGGSNAFAGCGGTSVAAGAPTECGYDIAAHVPAGVSFDAAAFNLTVVEAAATTALSKVDADAACGDEDGWYYDDAVAPARVLLCARSCERAEMGAGVNLVFGCTTLLREP